MKVENPVRKRLQLRRPVEPQAISVGRPDPSPRRHSEGEVQLLCRSPLCKWVSRSINTAGQSHLALNLDFAIPVLFLCNPLIASQGQSLIGLETVNLEILLIATCTSTMQQQ